jgi:Transposase
MAVAEQGDTGHDLRLLRGQLHPDGHGAPAGGRAGGPQLAPGPLGGCLHADVVEHLAGGAQLLARVGAAPLPPPPLPVQQVGAGQLRTHASAAQPGERLAVQPVGLGRFDGVAVIGVDEHVWRHTRRGDKYVTVIIDLPGVRVGTGPARLLDMVEGRSKQAFRQWLAARPRAWRPGVEVVAMDGFTGFKTATSAELRDAVAVMDPFHVVRLAGDALDQRRRRVQQTTCGHRGRAGDLLCAARRTLHTGAGLLTDKQTARSRPCSRRTSTSRSRPPPR